MTRSEPASPTVRAAPLDGIRSIAALSVFAYHLSRRAPALDPEWVHRVAGHLNVGVHVFFVLSGYLVFGPFARWLADRDAGTRPLLVPYAVRRVTRIWPAYLLALLAATWFGPAELEGWRGAIKHATLTHLYFEDTGGAGITVTWTLMVEWGFYLLVPAFATVFVLGRGRHRALHGALVVTAVGALAHWYVAMNLDTNRTLRVVPPALLCLGAGMALTAAVAVAATGRSARLAGRLEALGRRATSLVAIAGASLAAVVVLVPAGSDIVSSGGPRVLRELLQAVVAASLVTAAVLAGPRHWWPRLLGHPVLARFGLVSYGFYLWHVPVLRWLRPLLVDGRWPVALLGAGIALGIATLLASLSWRYLEAPIIARVAARFPARGARADSLSSR